MHEHGECKDIFALLSEYLDAELPAGACAEIEEHLKDCPPCIDFLESLKKTVRMCHEVEGQDQPAPLRDADRRKLAEAYQRMLASRGGAS